MKTSQIRNSFVQFFESKNHTHVPSSSLIPLDDPTLLFSNAGMNQFKNQFLGLVDLGFKRAVTIQKCVRAGGKHNDLDNVGFTARHHTFFEMLGNFSFGDYFKEDAIKYAWEFLTEELKISKDKLSVTIYKDDDEAEKIWIDIIGLTKDKITRLDEDNFWSMGETGPCGPCSEIFYDLGVEVDGERHVEIWNLVFMQFNRKSDGSLEKLDSPCIDTGMGLERISSIMQSQLSNYDTDNINSLIINLIKLAKKNNVDLVYKKNSNDNISSAIKVVVDHIRSISFLIADGVYPSNEGRGYVLRRILRRAIRYGKKLGFDEPFLFSLAPFLIDQYGGTYNELEENRNLILETMKAEEVKFFDTLSKGLTLLDGLIKKLDGQKILSGKDAFKLYDTFGFPVDLTEIICNEKNIKVDVDSFNQQMEIQKSLARKSWKGSRASLLPDEVKKWSNVNTEFVGFEKLECSSSVKNSLATKDGMWLQISPTPFYPTGGGQVGDTGVVKFNKNAYDIVNSIKLSPASYVVFVDAKKELPVNASVTCVVDGRLRSLSSSNHTATHLLHAALQNILGDHVKQAGSYVGPDRLRFDFNHSSSLKEDEIIKVEEQVNDVVQKGLQVSTKIMNHSEAIKLGAKALFGEKYGEKVRVVNIPDYSIELCGGTHVKNTQDIGQVKILSESSVSSGVRRIEAITNEQVEQYMNNFYLQIKEMSAQLKVSELEVAAKVTKLIEQNKKLQQEVNKLQRNLAQGDGAGDTQKELVASDFKLLAVDLGSDFDVKLMRDKSDHLRKQHKDTPILLFSGKNILVCCSNKLNNFNSGDFIKKLNSSFGGRGGGRDLLAQGTSDHDLSFDKVEKFIKEIYG